MTSLLEMFMDLEAGDPAESGVIAKQEIKIGCEVPREYRDFLLTANGVSGFLGKNFLSLWRVEDLAWLNEGYNTEGLEILLFGSDGSGEAFGFDLRSPERPIVMIPFLPFEWEEAVQIATTFPDFLDRLSHSEASDFINIDNISLPPGNA